MAHLFDFNYSNPTQIVFGTHSFAKLGADSAGRQGPAALRWRLDQAQWRLRAGHAGAGGRRIVEFAGVEPNPTLETLEQAVALVREQGVDFILGVGGGSVSDGAKFIACAALYYDGDGWDIVSGQHAPAGAAGWHRADPAGDRLGVECRGRGDQTGDAAEKGLLLRAAGPAAFRHPQSSVMASLPDRQLENGIVDAFVHVCEQYLTYPVGALVQDGYAEAVMKARKTWPIPSTSATTTPLAAEPDGAANQALWRHRRRRAAGLDHPRIAVELTALWGIDHGRTLSIVQPLAAARTGRASSAPSWSNWGRNVFGLAEPSAEDTIAAIEAFYRSLRMPLHLREAGIYRERCGRAGLAGCPEHGNAAARVRMPRSMRRRPNGLLAACG